MTPIDVLQQSKSLDARYRPLLEALPDILVVVNRAGTVLLVNGRAEALFGYRQDYLIGKPTEILLAERSRQSLVEHRADYLAQSKSRKNAVSLELIARRKDGCEFAAEIRLGPLAAQEGAFAVSVIRELTNGQRLQEELEQGQDALAQHDRLVQQTRRLKSEFLANMSHELRTPLNGIIGFAELMHDEKVGPISSDHKEYLQDILTSGRRLLQLINDVLDLAKLEAGKLEFVPEPINPANLVAEMCGIVRMPAAKKRIKIETYCDPALAAIQADARSLKRIVYNYLSNAVKFTPDEGKVIVRVKTEDSDHFRLEVEDTGIGIRPEDLDLLFLEFHRPDQPDPKQHRGSGLGLALTKEIVQAQHGQVGVSSTPGQGSVFYATLPRVLTVSPPVVRAGAEGCGFLPAQTAVPLILIIEDDANDRAWIAQALGGAGYAVEGVATGAQALVRCREQRFDAITLDIMLPDMSGQAVLEKLRERGLNQRTPIIIVTLLANQGIVAGFHVTHVLAKPVSQSKIVEAVARCGVMPGPPQPNSVEANMGGLKPLTDSTATRDGKREVL